MTKRSSMSLDDNLSMTTCLTDVLDIRADMEPGRGAFIFLHDGISEGKNLAYGELRQKSLIIAAHLQEISKKGDRAILLYPSGLDFIEAFYACLYSGVIAVPVFPPDSSNLNRSLSRLSAIIKDSGASVVLTTSNIADRFAETAAVMGVGQKIKCVETDNISPDAIRDTCHHRISEDDIAFLQYTSGSTRTPKGVMVSHGNLLHNLNYIKRGTGIGRNDVSVLWLPFFHDMGLINGVLQPVYTGYTSVLMPPSSFLQQPGRWLRAISKYGATYCGGPSFGYKLCASRVSVEEREKLDLAKWRVAYVGAEPIHKKDLDLFSEKFSTCGFNDKSFYPAYGLAEATVAVSGGHVNERPVVIETDPELLMKNIVRVTVSMPGAKHLVGCGKIWPGMEAVIVDPVTLEKSPADRIGEVWIRGGSVAKGYWNNKHDTEVAFMAYLASSGEGPYLRTGDLGFFHNGELFITGRIKDLIIIRGQNRYPQDIEKTAEKSHPLMRHGCSAAFSVEVDGEEKLVFVGEVRTSESGLKEVVNSIRASISKEHGISAHDVVLIKPGTVYKTSSGKIQRSACRKAYLEGGLEVLERSGMTKYKNEEETSSEKTPVARKFFEQKNENERFSFVVEYLRGLLSSRLNMPPSEIDFSVQLNETGIDSMDAADLTVQIENDFGASYVEMNLFENITLSELAEKIVLMLNDQHLSTSSVLKEEGKTSNEIPFHPGARHYSKEAVEARLRWAESCSGKNSDSIRKSLFSENPAMLAGNIENYIGTVQIPLGVAGPVLVNGTHAEGFFPLPIATTEGALVSSITRGAMVCNLAGGIDVRVNHQLMQRAPVFFCGDFHGAVKLDSWIKENADRIRKKAESASSVAKLKELQTKVFGDSLHVQFFYTTGDAAGQNMTTSCTWVACEWISEQAAKDPDIGLVDYFIEGNMSGDKKANYQNYITGRGISASASVFIPSSVLKKYLRTSVERYMRGWHAGAFGGMQTGMIGFNVNFANVIAGIFTSTGQDIACVHESGTGIFSAREKRDGILFSAHLPSLIIGTVGGGTGLPTQRECLEMMGCFGQGKSLKLAEIITAACLALDISTSASIAANEFVKSHEKFGRNRPDAGFKKTDINKKFFSSIMEKTGKSLYSFEEVSLDKGAGLVSDRLKEKSDKFRGLFKYDLEIESGGGFEKFSAVLKVKSEDSEIINLGTDLAKLSGDDRLPGFFETQNGVFGFENSHVREIEFYRSAKPDMLKFCPEIFGTKRNDAKSEYAVLMEDISGCGQLNAVASADLWPPETIELVLSEMSRLHSVYLDRKSEIPEAMKINALDEGVYLSSSPLLKELTSYNRGRYPALLSDGLYETCVNFIDNVSENIARMNAYHKTLTHNDFNPRNICVRGDSSGTRLVCYDWELASFQNPQHDLVEFLSYVLAEDSAAEEFEGYADFYFERLRENSGINLGRKEFGDIVLLNAVELAVNRYNLYLLAHNVMEFSFMERIYRNLGKFINSFLKNRKLLN